MNEQHEKLSALMDNYRATEQDESVLNDVLDDVNQQYTLRRYQLISDVMRNEVPQRIRLDFASDVMHQIKQEPLLHAGNVQPVTTHQSHGAAEQKPSWLWSVIFKPVAGLAVAATVAFVAVSNLSIQDLGQQPEQLASTDSSDQKVEQLAALPVIRNAVKVSAGSPNSASQTGMNWKIKRNEPAIQMKLNNYLINHNEYSSSIQGIIPQSRVVGFDVQK